MRAMDVGQGRGASEGAGEDASPGEVTRLLALASGGDPDAHRRVFSLVYDELRRLAAMSGQRGIASTRGAVCRSSAVAASWGRRARSIACCR